MASLKNTIAKKDEEIERLQLLKDLKYSYPGPEGERRGSSSSLRSNSPSSSKESAAGAPQKSQTPSSGKGSGLTEKAASNHDNSSEYSDKRSSEEADSQLSTEEDLKHQNDDIGQKNPADEHDDPEMLGFGDNADCEERLSDISDGDLSVGTELTDGSIENAMLAERGAKPNKSDR